MRRLVSTILGLVFVLAAAAVFFSVSPAYAQETTTTGDTSDLPAATNRIGPHEAGNRPNLPAEAIEGVPVTVILRSGDSVENWEATVRQYAAASQIVIRIGEIDVRTTTGRAAEVAAKLNDLAGRGAVRSGTIVVFGNELNNLDREWHSRPSAPASPVPDSEVESAARQYAPLFDSFHAALNKSAYRSAPSTVDMYNGIYGWVPWVRALRSQYGRAGALVANVYDVDYAGPAKVGIESYKDLQSAAGKSVNFFTEWGPHPDKNVYEHVKWLIEHDSAGEGLPDSVEGATTLIPDRCAAVFVRDVWLYYSKGKVYNKDGGVVEANADGTCGLSDKNQSPVFLYPRDPNESTKYLSNTSVYCAPPQIFHAVDPAILPPLTPCAEAGDQGIANYNSGKVLIDGVCTENEYPTVKAEDKWNLQNFSFPLFRSQTGGISIEADLSNATAFDTFANAFAKGTRPDYAPQFYLSSPQLQCLSAVRYIQHAQRLCAEWRPGKDGETCGANVAVTLPNGEQKRLFELAGQLSSEASCANFSQDLADDNDRAKAVRSINPMEPKVFKMGFLVQHTWLHDYFDRLFGQYLSEKIAAWFAGSPVGGDSDYVLGERLIVTPVWYHAGVATTEFDQSQTLPYSIDPTAAPSDTDPPVQEGNFVGPWWKTYTALLPDYVQKQIAGDRIRQVKQNYEAMQSYISFDPNNNNRWPITECTDKNSCVCLKRDANDQTCRNETIADFRSGFPANFEPDDAYLADLKAKIVARVNAGVQTTQLDDNGFPFSARSTVQCKVDQQNELYGKQESAQGILSSAFQALNDVSDDPSADTFREAVTAVGSSIWAKIKPTNSVENLKNRRTVRAYLVLPDEAMQIDIAQSYLTPMFLSPEMYAQIVKGENPVFPFNLDDKGQPKTQKRTFLSTFLRTFGLERSVEGDPKGYVQEELTRYRMDCLGPVITTGEEGEELLPSCSCTGEIVEQSLNPTWIEYDPQYQGEEPSVGNSCIRRELGDTSLTNIRPAKPGDNPDPQPQTAGQLAALNEFLRRQAFTPTYMQNYSTYPGLEQFYLGVGATGPQAGILPNAALTGLSQYFKALISNIGVSYSRAPKEAGCGVLYVNQADANRYAADLLAAVRKPEIWDWLVSKYTGANPFGTCAGMPCTQFIAQITTSVPVCAGDRYVNPLMAFAIALSEGGTTGSTGFFYGCQIAAFEKYLPGGTVGGLACTARTSTGLEALNPALMAQTNPSAITTEMLNSCIDQTGNAVPSRQNTAEDGLGCLLAYSQGSCVLGRDDLRVLTGYNETPLPQYGYDKIDHLQELATQITRAAKATGTYDAEVEAAQQRLRNDAAELKRRLATCSGE